MLSFHLRRLRGITVEIPPSTLSSPETATKISRLGSSSVFSPDVADVGAGKGPQGSGSSLEDVHWPD